MRIVTAPPVPGNVTAVEIDARTKAPLVKGGCLGTAEAGGFRGQSHGLLPYSLKNLPLSLFPKKPSPFHMGLYLWEVPAVESLSHGCAVPAPTGREPCGQWPPTMRTPGCPRWQFRTGIFCESLLPLQCPVSLPSKMGSENMGTVHALTAAAGRPARYRRPAATFSLFNLHYSLKNPPGRRFRPGGLVVLGCFQMTPWASMASATFRKPAMLAPAT